MLPYATDILIFGLQTTGIRQPFCIGDIRLHPHYDIRSYLQGYDTDVIEFIADSDVKFAQYRPNHDCPSRVFSPIVQDNGLLPLRLYKSGWLSGITVIPIGKFSSIQMRSEFGSLKQIFGQIWADPMHYVLKRSDIVAVESLYRSLQAVPTGYLEVACRRFSRSYEYYYHSEYAGISELDDCVVDLVIALESITSQENETRIKQHMTERMAKLLGINSTPTELDDIKEKVKKFYKHRSDIVHGNDKDETSDLDHAERFNDVESLRDLVRRSICACVRLLGKPNLALHEASGKRRTLPEIIDCECIL